ncbi:hypothetical protein, conserved [Plasmodium gonderi]|uniref:Uncharacterized protein n=1 Tax=Plasmodium gonderi TaxID=77519 RepID=A0A1Y1JN26_PLAGO|nr:hypothetical protein, conserved [Plasmodium gonderi]GAW82637.1 hypothetical protein, conserved [Plasmodium gonderi]
MFQKINCIPIIGKMYKNDHKHTAVAAQLLNKLVRINNCINFNNFINEKNQASRNIFDYRCSYLPLGNCTIYHNKVINYKIKNRRNDQVGEITKFFSPTYGIRNNIKVTNNDSENSHHTVKTKEGTDTTNWMNTLSEQKKLRFSWLKNIRKKQYYKIIGKIGVKKRNAGMYWSFYVNKRKKIRKKRRTI